MTLDQAIEELTKQLGPKYSTPNTPFHNAMKLLIEAGKRFKALREVIRVPYTELLPGEDPIFDNTRSLHTIKKVLESPPGRESGQ